MDSKESQTTEITNESKLLAAIVYVLGILVAVIIFLLKKDDKYVRFHAAQALLFDITVMLFSIPLTIILFAVFFVAGIVSFGVGFFLGFGVLWIGIMAFSVGIFLAKVFLGYKAYQGETFKLPFLGDQAEKIAV